MDADRKDQEVLIPTPYDSESIKSYSYNSDAIITRCFYRIYIMLLDIEDPDIKYDISADVMSMHYNAKYIFNNMPTMQISVITDENALFILKERYDTVKIIMTISMVEQVATGSGVDLFSPTEEVIHNGIELKLVSPVTCNIPPPKTLRFKTTSNIKEKDRAFVMDLVPKNALDNSQIMMNRSYSGISGGDALAIFGSNHFKLPVYMQIPHNTSIPSNVFVPPMRLNQAVQYMQDKYNIYRNGILFFNDINQTWIMDPKDRVDESSKFTTLILESMDPKIPESKANGTYKDENNIYIRSSVSPYMDNAANELVNTLGTVIKSVGSSQSSRFFNKIIETGIGVKNSKKISYMLNSSSIVDQASEFVRSQVNSQSNVIFKATQYDIRDITLEKLYKLVLFRNDVNPDGASTYNISELISSFDRVSTNANAAGSASNIFTIKSSFVLQKEKI